jgi:hypothetical protein
MSVGTLTVFSILLALAPLTLLFAGKQGSLDNFFTVFINNPATIEQNRTLFSAIAAVAAVNIVLIAFLVAAWREPTTTVVSTERHGGGEVKNPKAHKAE